LEVDRKKIDLLNPVPKPKLAKKEWFARENAALIDLIKL